jgi:hypothetical protein
MVEVHLMALESSAAVFARYIAKLSEKRGRRRLPPADSLDLAVSIRSVVANVLVALTLALGHDQS